MANYPILTEMGVVNPDEIERYSLVTSHHVDHLRIVYKRKKGSLLPISKKFKFGRSQKMVMTDRGRNKSETVHEISPFLAKATDELHSIVKSKNSRTDKKAILAEEILRLEEDTTARIAYIKQLLNEID